MGLDFKVAMSSEWGIILYESIKFLWMQKFNPVVWEQMVHDHESMNSRALQVSNPGVYKDFFNTHNIILSGDSVLTWWPDISHGVSVLRMKQKLPMKTYCWVNFNTSGMVTFRSIFVYDIVHRTFKQERFLTSFKYNVDKMSVFLQDFLRGQNFSGWVEIDFLTETPPGCGFAFSASVSVLLSILVYTITQKIDIWTLKNFELNEDHPFFEELYLFSLELSNVISQWNSIWWGSNYAMMIANHPLPIVYLSQINNQNVSNDTRLENTTPWVLSAVDTTLYKDTLLHFLWMESLLGWELPLDYGILYTGLEYRFDTIESTRELEKRRERWLDSLVNTILASLPIERELRNSIAKLLDFEKEDTIYKIIDILNLKILNGFHSILKEPMNVDLMTAFIEMVQNVGLSSFSYQKPNELFFALQHSFYQLKQYEDECIGIMPFNSWAIGGSLLFVMRKGKSRATLQKVLTSLRKEWHTILLHHASWRDGTSSDGVRIEQYVDEKIYSQYTKLWDVHFADSHGKSYCGSYDTILKDQTDGILLDTIGGRIYIKGIKLTSKDIHSQNTTIDMLKLLLENMGKEVSNSKLPVSSYAQNKNEILGKVVLPIRKISKEYFDTELSLTCSGGITEYYLRLERNDTIPVGIIKTLTNL